MKLFVLCLFVTCFINLHKDSIKEGIAVQTQHYSSCFMQQDTQIMSLHANKRVLLNNIIFDRKKMRKAKTLDHPRVSIKITKYGTNKFIVVSALADTGAQSNL